MSTESVSRPRSGVAALVGTVVGLLVMVWSFAAGVPAALDGGGSGAFAYVVLFIAGAALVLAGLVIAIVNLVRGRSRGIALVTVLLGLAAIIGVVALRLAAIG